ncbi:amidohydrolase [Leucobacter sp. UT-8R-CII-1-4]|uniref:amidohydrolase n=1 Tax=Leucobacter sp. UT-8R-CII-1-4 TaxID=3040075 RepID=UPI0024A9DB31|nr:amidohydrolase [Leucobacter sp. UT-8R-CII-1-4]MDI6022689.1 amidohydrolase [Leucobacter sp. UT-8R-CII-1-4]
MQSQALDLAIIGGAVFDGEKYIPAPCDIGIQGGRIVLIGEEVQAAIAEGTEVIDAAGRLVHPGMNDSHVHPIEAGMEMLGCNLADGWDRDDYLTTVREYVASHPDVEWIVGAGWQQAAFPGGAPLKDDLDAICSDRPIILSNRDHHSAWVNSEALRRCGIDANTPDPSDGRIERDADGNPTGTLHEGARMLALSHAPQPTIEAMYEGFLVGQRKLVGYGITSWQDALIGQYGNHSPEFYTVYRDAEDRGELIARVNGALWWERTQGVEQIGAFIERRDAVSGRRFRADTIKIMQDGVAENQTAAMIEPYLEPYAIPGGCAHRVTDNSGISFVDPERLREYVTELDRQGFQVHFHALGDRGVRESLDAIEAARTANGEASTQMHTIAHIQVISPDDVPRFAPLNADANMQPLWASYDPQMIDLTVPFLGEERIAHQYPFASLHAAGAHLSGGSDWPVTSADPWLGIHVAVNRQVPVDHPDYNEQVFFESERLPLDVALRAYTLGGIETNGRAHEVGSIALGMLADVVIANRDPFTASADTIHETSAARVYVDGVLVHHNED